MRRSRPDNLIHPAVLLALSLTLCGGSLYAGNQPEALLQTWAAERATDLKAGQREAVAQLMQCLADAAKELQKHDGTAVMPAQTTEFDVLPCSRAAQAPPRHASPPVRLIGLHHLDLPPPAAPL